MFSNSKPLLLFAACVFASAAAYAGQRSAVSPAVSGAVTPATSLATSSALAGSEPSAKERSRLEELFIWKTSEELRLAPLEEQKFTEAIHVLNKRRRDANAKMDAALIALSKAKTKAEAEMALATHRAALRDVQAVQAAEIDRLRPLLGPVKLAQYIVAKSSILDKLKSMLAAPPIPVATAPAPGASTSGATSAIPTK